MNEHLSHWPTRHLRDAERIAREDAAHLARLNAIVRAEIDAGKAQRAAVVAGMARTSTERADRLRAKRAAAGLCRDCGKRERTEERQTCEPCAEARRQREATRGTP